MKLLIVKHDRQAAEAITRSLREYGYQPVVDEMSLLRTGEMMWLRA